MTDIWGFLLQTLTASGAAVLLLVVKAVFRDKLSPRWQAGIWGVLGLVLLIPAGWGGRYVLVNWPWLAETLKTALTGDYGLTSVTAPIPLPHPALPETAAEWVFAAYVLGVLVFLARYAVSYFRLRLALRRGTPAGAEPSAQIAAAAETYGLPSCPAVEVPGLQSAFVCGVFRPVLALPAGEVLDEKVLLHELLHLKHRDAAWGLVICLFRCIHWCNPLLWYCADRAGNDLESLCDQRVLERLEGEDRRDYGRILLSMANERYPRTPGTSSMANGGQNIRRRIEAIARFKRYPAGMGLVSVCAAVILALPLLLGTRSQAVSAGESLSGSLGQAAAMASARTVPCTTYAGALDAYAKAVLDQNFLYRALCAPLAEQSALAAELRAAEDGGDGLWDSGIPAEPHQRSGYTYYNLWETAPEVWEALLVVELLDPPDMEPDTYYLACQTVRAYREDRRWVVVPQGDFQTVTTQDGSWASWGCEDLPAFLYQAEAGDFRVTVRHQTSCKVTSTVTMEDSGSWFFGPQTSFDLTPQPRAEFDDVSENDLLLAEYIGEPDGQAAYRQIGVSVDSMAAGEERPELRNPGNQGGSGSSSDGSSWASTRLGPGDLDGVLFLGGGGSGYQGIGELGPPPVSYAADLYLNGELAAELTLLPVEGGAQ